MISFLRRYQKTLFIAVITIFLIGTFVGLGGYLFTSKDMSESVASVGAAKIPYSRFIARVNQYVDGIRGRGADVTDEMVRQIKQEMVRDMIVDELLLVKADEYGLIVTDAELARDVRNTPAFQRNGGFSEDAYFQAVRQIFRETPQGYEETRRRTMLTSKLKQLIFQSAKLAPAELKDLYARDHKGSLKDFEKDKVSFASSAQQKRALDLINYYLRQLSTQVEVRSFLDQRESGS